MIELIFVVAVVMLVVVKVLEKLFEGKLIYELLDRVDELSGAKIFPKGQVPEGVQDGRSEQMHQMHETHHEMFQEQAQQADEMARMAATGIEFGGTNCDLNLNPGMSSMMDNSMHNLF